MNEALQKLMMEALRHSGELIERSSVQAKKVTDMAKVAEGKDGLVSEEDTIKALDAVKELGMVLGELEGMQWLATKIAEIGKRG